MSATGELVTRVLEVSTKTAYSLDQSLDPSIRTYSYFLFVFLSFIHLSMFSSPFLLFSSSRLLIKTEALCSRLQGIATYVKLYLTNDGYRDACWRVGFPSFPLLSFTFHFFPSRSPFLSPACGSQVWLSSLGGSGNQSLESPESSGSIDYTHFPY